jgi:hypothetical protein
MFFRTVELHAGMLTDADGELPTVGTILIQSKLNDTQKYGIQLSPDGHAIAWSTRSTDTGTEDLQFKSLDDGSQASMVATDVSAWSISSDSKKYFWLKGFNYSSTGAPSGTLQTANYPDGSSPVTIAPGVGDFTQAGGGILYRSQVTGDVGTLLLVPDRTMPATVKMLDSGVAFVFGATTDGKVATYTKNVGTDTRTGATVFDVYAGNSAGTMACTLTATTTAVLPPTFLAAGGLMAWARLNPLTHVLEGMQTTLPGCATSKFADDLSDLAPIGDEGLVYLDTVDPDPNIFEATLRYGKIANGTLPATGTVIQARAGLQFSALLPSLASVVYTMTTNTSVDGLYINSPLPFTVTAPVPDGGTGVPDAGTSEAGAPEAGVPEAGAPETNGGDDGSADVASGG